MYRRFAGLKGWFTSAIANWIITSQTLHQSQPFYQSVWYWENLITLYNIMCDFDYCTCSSFAPHLWKIGECRECHHPLASHTKVNTGSLPATSLEKRIEEFHVRKLSSERLQPFNSPTLTRSTSLSPKGRPRSVTVGQLAINTDVFAGLYTTLETKKPRSRSLVDAPKETDEVQIAKVINEIVSTEKDYCKDLDYVIDVSCFVPSAQTYFAFQKIMIPLTAKSIVDKNTLSLMFSNIQEIRNVNTALLQYLEQYANLTAVGVCEIFSKMVRILKTFFYGKKCLFTF